MKTDERVANVYRTNNLSQFKIMLGNRDVTTARVKRIKDSIKKNGYLHSPILVNERNEVIDGQGRLAACKELGCEIEYIVAPGFGIEQCRTLNMLAKNWTLADYIDSYAESGNVSYLRMKNLLKIYSHINAVKFAAAFYGAKGTSHINMIQEGRLVIDEDTYKEAEEALAWLREVMPLLASRARGKGIECALIIATTSI